MKKIVLFLVIAMMMGGVVWGQQFPIANVRSAMGTVALWDFDVIQTVSTEKRYSAGIFGNYIDDYMWYTGYDVDVGTFLMLGGYPSTGDPSTVANGGIGTTDYLMTTDYTLNFGFAKSLKGSYLGVYYGGDLVSARGVNNGLDGDDASTAATATWKNRVAILFGKPGLGGIRFDMNMPDSTYLSGATPKTATDKAATLLAVTDAPSLSLGWGNALANGMEVYAQLGYRFAQLMTMTIDGKTSTIWGNINPDFGNPGETLTTGGLDPNAKLALQVGLWMPLASTETSSSSLAVDFVIGGIFGASAKVEYPDATGPYPFKTQTDLGGVFLIGTEVAYKQTINVGKLSIGFKPLVDIGFVSDDSNSIIAGKEDEGTKKADMRKQVDFELSAGVNVGVKYQATDKIALYTGVALNVFDWQASGWVEGNDDKYKKDEPAQTGAKSSAWTIDGLEWNMKQMHSGGTLGFGLTFAPTEKIILGVGLSQLLDKFININLAEMSINAGNGFAAGNNANSSLGYMGYFLRGVKFDLTIAAKL